MSAQNFTTQNPDQLIYENEFLIITVLGGIKLEGLDRMRVTLKVELNKSARPAVRHNLDLYNDTQLEKFIRKVAEKHEIGTSVVAACLSELTDHLEGYRLEALEAQTNNELKPKQLSSEEIAEAESFLSAPNLLERTNELIGQSGVIGEVNNRLIMFLIFTSRKRAQPLHVVSLGASGMGKTHLQERVGELIPEEDRIEITTLSENAFYYFGQRELKNKLILIEDLDGAEGALYPLRELQSKRKISKTVAHKNTKGETRSVHLVVEGPVSVSGCTTKEHIYEDNSNRSFLLYLDESQSQTDLIMGYQRAISANQIDRKQEQSAAELLRNSQRLLQPIKVVNPYAEILQLPTEIFKPRRTNSHYLQFIEAVTFYHQKQREIKTGGELVEPYIETTLEDIEAANQLLKEILLRKSDELTGACRNYLESIKAYLEQENKSKFNNREIRKALKVNESNQKRYTLNLLSNYYLKRVKGTKSKGYEYEVVSYQEFKELKEQIGSVLDTTLSKLKAILADKENQPFSGRPPRTERSKVVQNRNEPRKTKPVKKKAV